MLKKLKCFFQVKRKIHRLGVNQEGVEGRSMVEEEAAMCCGWGFDCWTETEPSFSSSIEGVEDSDAIKIRFLVHFLFSFSFSFLFARILSLLVEIK